MHRRLCAVLALAVIALAIGCKEKKQEVSWKEAEAIIFRTGKRRAGRQRNAR